MSGPLVHLDIQAVGGTGVWQKASRFSIWTREYHKDAPALAIVESHDGGLLRIPNAERMLHVIPAGRPHRIEHLFGFWRVAGTDTVFIRAELEDTLSYTLIVRNDWPEYTDDKIVLACPSCGRELQQVAVPTPRFGVQAYWDEALRIVRAYNADEAARRCAECRRLADGVYGIDDALDTELEREARLAG